METEPETQVSLCFCLLSEGSVDGFLLVLVLMLTDNHIFLSLPFHCPAFTFAFT